MYFCNHLDVESISVLVCWRFSLAFTRWQQSTSYSTPGPVNTWMGDCLRADKSSQHVTNYHVNSALRPSGVGKSSTRLRAGVKAGRVHLCRVARNAM